MHAVKGLMIGRVYLVSTKMARSPVSDTYTAYPWGDKDTKIPVRVLDEYSDWYLVDVLPHISRYTRGSKPYRLTIDKFDLQNEFFKAWEADDNETIDDLLYDYVDGGDTGETN